ncbi:hypothetical protein [Paenibacillus pasadenensis]|uniref:hypothetical protein n=1 Tax=Paenibacillus pasadenensis TaxID=217090 RepID=UPI0011AF3975|nr:hypothetical protein [Paenibacillus pasadenensis]
MPNTSGIARLSEQADRLLEHVEEAQSLLTAIILHIEQHAASLSPANAQSVTLEAHRQFSRADRKLLKCKLRLIHERSRHEDK